MSITLRSSRLINLTPEWEVAINTPGLDTQMKTKIKTVVDRRMDARRVGVMNHTWEDSEMNLIVELLKAPYSLSIETICVLLQRSKDSVVSKCNREGQPLPFFQVAKKIWTPKENRLLLQLVSKDRSWKEITEEFNNKTTMCKRNPDALRRQFARLQQG